MTLTYQLEQLYDSKWSGLKEQLEKYRIQIRAPLLLSVNKYDTDNFESWYTDADLKVMIFGQEVNRWECLSTNSPIPADFMEMYQEFYHTNYHEKSEGIYFSVKAPFFNIGVNGFTSEITEYLHKEYPNKRAAFLWNNISKLAAVGKNGTGVAVDSLTHQIEQEYFRVIPDEIEILKPDILIFLTGVNEKYNRYISENFSIHDEPFQIAGLPTKEVAKLNISKVKLAYRTHHPAQRCSGAMLWTCYDAILDDIKSRLRYIL